MGSTSRKSFFWKKNREWFPLAEKAPSGENNGKRFPLVEKTASSGKKNRKWFPPAKKSAFSCKKNQK